MHVISRQDIIQPKALEIEHILGSDKKRPYKNEPDSKALSAFLLLQLTRHVKPLQPICSNYVFNLKVKQWVELYLPENNITTMFELRPILTKIVSDWQIDNLIYIEPTPYCELRLVYIDQKFPYLDEPVYVSKQRPNFCFLAQDNKLKLEKISLSRFSDILSGVLNTNDTEAIDYYRNHTGVNSSNSKITDILLDYLDSAWLFLPTTPTMLKFLYSLNGLGEPSELALTTILELTKDCSMEEVATLIKNTSHCGSLSLDLPEL